MGGQSNKYWLNLIAEIQKDIRPSATRNYQPILNDLAQYIDHTLLKLDTTPAQIDTLCDEAIEYSFKVQIMIAFTLQNIRFPTKSDHGLYRPRTDSTLLLDSMRKTSIRRASGCSTA